MNERKQILLVDDSPNEIRVLMESLKAGYAVLAATSGQAAIDAVASSVPDLVLMDVTMSPMDGYETCRILQRDYPQVPVIFVSANSGTEEILKGFDAGGQDYVTKPVDPAVLINKVKIVFEQIERKRQLKDEKQQVSEMAEAAMSSAGDLNIILAYLRQAAKLAQQADLAQLLATTIEGYGISASAQIRDAKGGVFNRAGAGGFAPLEEEILASSVNIDGQVLEKGRRLIIVHGSVSLLVKDMPVDDDAQRCIELRDYLLILAENTNDLNQKICDEISIAEQRMSFVLEAVKDANESLSAIQTFQKAYKEDSVRIMDEILAEVEASFFSMGLTEEQEKKITIVIQNKLNEGIHHMEAGLRVDEQLRHLTENLGELTRNL